jgi:hypothetical protein
MADIKLSIDDLPPATTVYNADVFVIDQLGSDGYTKKLTYQSLKTKLGSDSFVLRAGDTMTGALILNTSSPATALQAASKGYVDTFLSKAGGTMTGNLILNTSTPTNALQATSRAYVQNNFLPISGIGTGAQGTGMTGFLTLCAHPTSAFHAATKYYVDNRSSDGLAKAWVTFSGQTGTAVVSASYNVSTVTRISAGDYQFRFATNMTNSIYGIFINDNYEGTGAVNRFVVSQAVTGARIKFKDSGAGGNVYDPVLAYVNIFGN